MQALRPAKPIVWIPVESYVNPSLLSLCWAWHGLLGLNGAEARSHLRRIPDVARL